MVAILFGRSKKHPKKTLTVSNHQIPWTNKATYLGVIFDRTLTFNEQVKHTILRAKRIRAMFYPVLNQRSPIPMITRLSTYKIYIRPILLYATTAWGHLLSRTNWTKIEAVQNVALRTITGVYYLTNNHTTQQTTKINPLHVEIIRAARVFCFTNSRSTFQHIRNIGILPTEKKLDIRPKTLTTHPVKPGKE